tara:strand:+ start:1051 stop:1338 length:288 start_codon:yes stop_codon:yes gene_type:complete
MSSAEKSVPTPSRYIVIALQAMVYLYTFNLFSYTTADPDLWGHIKFREEIRLSGSLPETNFYSYNAPDHPWINRTSGIQTRAGDVNYLSSDKPMP